MPGPHVDLIFNDALGKLTDPGMINTEIAKLPPEQQRIEMAKKDNKVGKEVFEQVEASGLTPAEKQEVYRRLVKAGVQDNLDHATNPATLLRENSKMTNFMSSYMNVYAKDYLDSVVKVGMEESAKIKLPPSLKGKLPRTAFGEVTDVPPQDVQQLHDSYVDVSQKMLHASEENLDKLSPEARAFLQAGLEPTGDNTEALNMATASTLILRGVSPILSSAGDKMRLDPETAVVGQMLMGSSVVMQTYANTINTPEDQKLGTEKKQNIAAERLRTPENMAQTKAAYKAVSKGSDGIDRFTQIMRKNAEAREMEAKLKPFDNRLNALAEKRSQLQNNPTFGDKFKAFFKHGLKGVQGEVESINKKIAVTELAKDDVQKGVSMDERRQILDTTKKASQELGNDMAQAKGVTIERNLEHSLGGLGSNVTDQDVDKAINRHEQAGKLKAQVDQQVKTQEKVLSVREKLQLKPQAPVQGQKKGVKV